MKNISNKILEFISHTYGTALCVIILHLAAVYGKQLYFLNPDSVNKWFDVILFGAIGSGYSLLTINVIARAKSRAINIFFALFDTLSVFLYYNGLQYILTDTYIVNGITQTFEGNITILVRSIFISVLTGFSVFVLGEIFIKTDRNGKSEKETVIKRVIIPEHRLGFLLYAKSRLKKMKGKGIIVAKIEDELKELEDINILEKIYERYEED